MRVLTPLERALLTQIRHPSGGDKLRYDAHVTLDSLCYVSAAAIVSFAPDADRGLAVLVEQFVTRLRNEVANYDRDPVYVENDKPRSKPSLFAAWRSARNH